MKSHNAGCCRIADYDVGLAWSVYIPGHTDSQPLPQWQDDLEKSLMFSETLFRKMMR